MCKTLSTLCMCFVMQHRVGSICVCVCVCVCWAAAQLYSNVALLIVAVKSMWHWRIPALRPCTKPLLQPVLLLYAHHLEHIVKIHSSYFDTFLPFNVKHWNTYFTGLIQKLQSIWKLHDWLPTNTKYIAELPE